MAKRYIGDAVVTITYRDRGDYKGKICASGHCWHFEDLRAPRAGLGSGVAYDSAVAYDKMAASAASFGSYEDDAIDEATAWAQYANGGYEVRRQRIGGRGYDVRPSRSSNPRRRYNPLQRNPLSQIWGKR